MVVLCIVCTITGFWVWEAIVLQNDLSPTKIPIWRYWVIPLALLAFWYPVDPRTLMPDCNPVHLFTDGAGIALCTMTPVYVGLLTIYYPRVNIATFRVTSLVGLIIGLYNMNLNFIISPGILWCNGILHIPLLGISAYGLILSLKKEPCRQGHSKPNMLDQNRSFSCLE